MIQFISIVVLTFALGLVLLGAITTWLERGRTRLQGIALTVVGVLVCIVGILAFVLAGVTETEGWTAQENWLFSAGCCLLPIAGSGLVLVLAGVGIWFARLRGS